jgi:hypothetical protein
MSALRLTVGAYGAAAAALPCAAYLAQPERCFWYLYLPWYAALVGLVCAAASAAQWFSVLSDKLRVAAAVLFGLAIQATVLVPCVSDEAESERVLRLALVTLVAGAFAACTLLVTVVGLLRRARVGAVMAGMCLALVAFTLGLGAARQYIGITGIGTWAAAPFADVHVPSVLALASSATLLGAVVAAFRREQVSRMWQSGPA